MTKRVALACTADERFWDTGADEIVFLGNACRRYSRRSAWAGLPATLARCPWDDPAERLRASELVEATFQQLVPAFADALNRLHGSAHGIRYWQILLGPWLRSYIAAIYDRYLRLKYVFEDHPDIATIGLLDTCFVTARDTSDFGRSLIEDTFNVQLYTKVLAALGHAFPAREAVVSSTRIATAPPSAAWKRWVKPPLQKMIGWLMAAWPAANKILLTQPYMDRRFELLSPLLSAGSIWPNLPVATENPAVGIDPARRAALQFDVQDRSEFMAVLLTIAPGEIPVSFIEAREHFVNAAARYLPFTPRAAFSANSWHFDELFKYWAAAASEKGVRLIASQHGGNYGIAPYIPHEIQERLVADCYYTWGWDAAPGDARHGNEKLRAYMPSTKLSSIKRHAHDRGNGRILYVGTAEPRYLESLQGIPEDIAAYIERQQRFLASLPAPLKSALRARLYPEDFGWDIRPRWQDLAPQVEFDEFSRPFLVSLEQCGLFLCDHIGTTMVEALTANCPTILFFGPERETVRPEARPYLDALAEVEILCPSPEHAADVTARVYPDIAGWWSDSRRQAARLRFCARFAKTSATAWQDWLQEFRKIRSGQ